MMKIHVKQTIVINLPVADIFAYMSNLENMVEWSNVMIEAKTLSPAGVCLGTRVKNVVQFLGKRSEMTFEVVECQPGNALTIKSISGVSPCFFCFQFESLEDGGTSVTQDAVVSLIGGCVDLAERVVTNAIHRHLEHDLLTLKDMLETHSSTRRSAARA